MTTSTRIDAQTSARPDGRRIDYPFDHPPKQAREALEAGKISPTDYAVLVELLRFQGAFRGSCWTSKKTIAEALDITTKTVQRSYKSLCAAGLIRQSQVSPPGHKDPDEPKNKTGWRIHFLFVDAVRPPGSSGPDRRAPADRKKQACTSTKQACNSGGGEDTNVLPPQDTNVLQYSKDLRPSEGMNLDDNNQMETEHPCKSSSFPDRSFEDQGPEGPEKAREVELLGAVPPRQVPAVTCTHVEGNPGSADVPSDEVDELLRRAAVVAKSLPSLTRPKVRDWVRDYGVALAMWAVVLLARLLTHPNSKMRPRGAHYADVPLQKWRKWFGDVKPEELPAESREEILRAVQADVDDQTRLCVFRGFPGEPDGPARADPETPSHGSKLPSDPAERKRLAAQTVEEAKWHGLDETTFRPTKPWPSHIVERWNALKAEIRELFVAGKESRHADP